jgi:hypothetical protein
MTANEPVSAHIAHDANAVNSWLPIAEDVRVEDRRERSTGGRLSIVEDSVSAYRKDQEVKVVRAIYRSAGSVWPGEVGVVVAVTGDGYKVWSLPGLSPPSSRTRISGRRKAVTGNRSGDRRTPDRSVRGRVLQLCGSCVRLGGSCVRPGGSCVRLAGSRVTQSVSCRSRLSLCCCVTGRSAWCCCWSPCWDTRGCVGSGRGSGVVGVSAGTAARRSGVGPGYAQAARAQAGRSGSDAERWNRWPDGGRRDERERPDHPSGVPPRGHDSPSGAGPVTPH